MIIDDINPMTHISVTAVNHDPQRSFGPVFFYWYVLSNFLLSRVDISLVTISFITY